MNPTALRMLNPPTDPHNDISGFVFPHQSVQDKIFEVAYQKRNDLKMFLGFSGQGKTIGMNLLGTQFQRIGDQNFCVRSCHVSFRRVRGAAPDACALEFIQSIGGLSGSPVCYFQW
jgi:hypothetical protein